MHCLKNKVIRCLMVIPLCTIMVYCIYLGYEYSRLPEILIILSSLVLICVTVIIYKRVIFNLRIQSLFKQAGKQIFRTLCVYDENESLLIICDNGVLFNKDNQYDYEYMKYADIHIDVISEYKMLLKVNSMDETYGVSFFTKFHLNTVLFKLQEKGSIINKKGF